MAIKFVYIAGPLRPKVDSPYQSKSLWIDYLLNVRNMVKYTLKVIQAGFTPFCPGIDFTYLLMSDDDYRPTEATIMRLSKDWLSCCNAILLIPGWQKSEGTKKEIELANELKIPIFESIKELKEYNERNIK